MTGTTTGRARSARMAAGLALALLATLALAACGGGDEEQPAETNPTPAPVAEPAPAPAAASELAPVAPAADNIAPPPPAAAPTPAPEPTPAPAAEPTPAPAAPPGPPAAPAAETPAPVTPQPTPPPAAAALPAEPVADAVFLALMAAADPNAGERFRGRCAVCHTFPEGATGGAGPNLFGIVNEPIGRDPTFAYSDAFRALNAAGAIWTPARLNAFLAAPGEAIPGTAKTTPIVDDAEERANIITYLATLVPATPEAGAAAGAGATGDPELIARIANADPEAGEDIAAVCTRCHTFDEGGADLTGPNLYEIVGAPIGGRAGFTYSRAFVALHDAGETWTLDRLDAYLRNSQAAILGTRMGFTGIADDEQRADLIAYLRSLADAPPPIPVRIGTYVAGLNPVAFALGQASGGQTLFANQCASCHGAALEGVTGMGPALIGAEFAARRLQGTVWSLYEYIRSTMPPNNRRGFANNDYIDIVTFILRENGYEGVGDIRVALGINPEVLQETGLFQY